MDRSKATPAPWEIWDNDDNHSGPGCWYVIKHGDECVCEIYAIDEENPDVEKHEANARLIAAAPELFEACEDALRQIEVFTKDHGACGFYIDQLIEAIAKAKGEA